MTPVPKLTVAVQVILVAVTPEEVTPFMLSVTVTLFELVAETLTVYPTEAVAVQYN